MLSNSFEDLAQSFRVLLESDWHFRRLISIDRAEAIGTVETALNAKLNAFHSLFDSMQKEGIRCPNWYETPELSIILAIRNARHHNKANRIRSLYNFHRFQYRQRTQSVEYLYVDFPAPREEEGGDCFDVPLSWGDLDSYLSLPKKESHLRDGVGVRIREYVNAELFEEKAASLGIDKSHVFFNFVPLSLNAGISLSTAVADRVESDSTEAKYFLHHFKTVKPALTRVHEYKLVEFCFPNER